MDAGAILLGVGIALLVAALLGGLVRAAGMLRIVIAAAGALCVIAATILLTTDAPEEDAGGVKAVLRDTLGKDQISEEVKVTIDGRDAGVLRVDKRTPVTKFTIRVPKVGVHTYRLDVTRLKKGASPTRSTNSGKVRIDGIGELAMFAGPEGKTYLLPVTQ